MTDTLPPREHRPARYQGFLPYAWVRTGRRTAVTWLVSRLVMLGIFLLTSTYIVGDVTYYWRKLQALTQVGLANTLNEYPTPVVWILEVPWLVALGHHDAYLVTFIVAMAVLDAWMLIVFWRAAGRRPSPGVDFWIVFSWLIGMLIYVRFDMIPAVLVGVALVWLQRRPRVAGALIGVGAAVKLWPALLFPSLLARRGGRGRFTVGFVVLGVGLAVVSVITGGVERLFSPLTWQSARGLQIESVWAAPLMIARAFSPGSWRVEMSKYQAFEVFGSGVSGWLAMSTLATVVGLAAIILLIVRSYRHPAPDGWQLGLVALSIVLIMIVTNKTLSPQYVLWAGPPIAYLMIAAGGRPDRAGVSRRLGWCALGVALLTQLIYPQGYNFLLGYLGGHTMMVVATFVLAVRNAGLLGLTIWVALLASLRLRPEPATADDAPAVANP